MWSIAVLFLSNIIIYRNADKFNITRLNNFVLEIIIELSYKERGVTMADKDFSAIAIGKRITECRKMLGLTQEELAEKGDMTTQFVSYAESGKRVIRSENLLKLSKALEVSADFLLTGEIVDKDMFIMSEKLSKLSSKQFKFIESIVDKCNELFW